MKTKRREMRTVLIKIYLLTMFLALTIGLSVFGMINDKVYMEQSSAESIKNCHDFAATLDLILDAPIYITSQIAMDENIQIMLEESNKTGNLINVYAEKDIGDILSKYLPTHDGIRSIHIIDINNYMVSRYVKESEVPYEEEIINDLNSIEVYNNKGKEYIDISNNMGGDSLESSIYISRTIRSKSDLRQLGCIVMVISSDYIRSITKGYLEYMNFSAMLVSQDGDYFEFDKKQTFAIDYLARESSNTSKDYHVIDYANNTMQIIGKIEKKKIDDSWINITIVIVVVNIIFMIVMILLLGKRIVYPLEKIAYEAKKIANTEDLGLRVDIVGAYEEIALLSEAINEMLQNVEQLVTKVKEKEQMQRILELSVINHQINPHFLYNTLNSVAILVAMEEKEEAQSLIESLANYYRACLNQSDMNTVGQEIIILKEYINIMHIKNSELVRIDYEIDSSLVKETMPRMILQTLVENSIKYGIKTTDEPLQINVKVCRENTNERMVISVKDNGKGIDQDTIDNILNDRTLKNKSGFGLKSTIKRIKLMNVKSDIKDVLEIRSELEKYTEIRVYIPINMGSQVLLNGEI